MRTGLLWRLGEKLTPFSDRFQLGGPSSVRMFRMNSMGPRDGGIVALRLCLDLAIDKLPAVLQRTHWVVICIGLRA